MIKYKIRSNELADGLAKLGAAMHPFNEEAYGDIKNASALTQVTSRYIAQAACQFAEFDKREKLDRVIVERDRGNGIADWKPDEHVAIFDEALRRWRCKRCLITSAAPMRLGPCLSTWRQRGHQLLAVGTFFYCIKCKAFTQSRVRKLLGECRPTQRFTTEARRLEQGRNPYDNLFIVTPVPWTEGVLTHGEIGWAATLEEELQKAVWLEDSR